VGQTALPQTWEGEMSKSVFRLLIFAVASSASFVYVYFAKTDLAILSALLGIGAQQCIIYDK
jgi:hypothetical protein